MEVFSSPSEQETVDLFLSEPTEESFCAMFRAVAPQIIRYFRARGCEPSLSEDLTQEVMLAVFRQVSMLRDRKFFRPWIFKIARNALLQHLRRESRNVQTTELDVRVHDSVGPAGDLLSGSSFAQWLAYLGPNDRQALMLRYVEDLEYHEIAEVLSIPLGTVQWRIFQAKRKLAARFGPQPV
jgi:RNA polymerase sigma-70 factor (ECF subfamily)